MKYVAGYNQPGYLPEMEPQEFDTVEDAVDFLVEEFERAEDDIEDDWALVVFVDELENQDEPFSILGPDGYAYWVVEDDE